MWNHLGIVGLAAAAAVISAEGLMTYERAHHAEAAQSAPQAQAQAQAQIQAPAPAYPPASDAAVLKGDDGHYWAEASVDGERVRFLVDTGATAVALTLTDARRLGLDIDRLNFNQIVRTASGDAHAAQVELDYVAVAGARVDNVTALVVDSGLQTSLLGMTYLGRLSRFEATPGALILRP